MYNEITIFWFRRDLRLNDNAGLYHALKNSNSVLPIFIFDTNILNKLQNKEDKRITYIYNTLTEIHRELIAYGSSLLVYKGDPYEVFLELVRNYRIKAVYTNHDYEPDAVVRDNKISGLLTNQHIAFYSFKDQVIFEKSEIIKPDNTPYTIYTPYSKAWKQKLTEKDTNFYSCEQFFNRFYKSAPVKMPEISVIGFTKTENIVTYPIIDEDVIRNYHNTRNFPYLTGTTNLSVHLRFGTVSIRKLVKVALQLNEYWLNELIWREFFKMILYHFPYVENESFKRKYNRIEWRNNEEEFQRWCRGETGYPIVDAGMIELNETGLMHNRIRMVVASFLTKHLLIDWRWGEAYFAEMLMDYDLSSNNGNWQWAAGSGCDATPYFRIFNPSEQTRKFDPQLIYCKKWVKNLTETDYPLPIVDHKLARERALKVYKSAVSG